MWRTGACAALLAAAGCQTPTAVVVPAAPARFAEDAAPRGVPLDALRARREAARKMSNPFTRDEALQELVAEAAARGDATNPAALGAAVQDGLRAISNPFTRDEAAGKCVKALARRNLAAEAAAVAGTMTNPFDRDEALKALVAGKP